MNNIKFTDSKFGAGPLPTSDVLSGGPAGINGDPDGQINAAGSLLGNITPYSYAEGARMGSDKNYQQIPHRMQHIIHQLYLPYADKTQNELFAVSHAVDQGDIAFIVQTSRVQGMLFNQHMQRDISISRAQMPKRNAFINLPTLNFILAGLQRIKTGDSIHLPWKSLAIDLGYQFCNNDNSLKSVLHVVKNVFIPYGICAGSEHQGGKHETGMAPVQAAVNHVTTMTVDGQNRDLINYWRKKDIGAGDQLIFRLEYLPTQSYTLNHYYKGTVHQMYPTKEWCWQVVPDKFEMTYNPKMYENSQRYDSPEVLSYDYRLHGYWRIGQMFQHRGKHDIQVENYSNDLCFLRGQLLQITFGPMWIEYEKPDALLMCYRNSQEGKTTNERSDISQTTDKKPRTLGSRGPLTAPKLPNFSLPKLKKLKTDTHQTLRVFQVPGTNPVKLTNSSNPTHTTHPSTMVHSLVASTGRSEVSAGGGGGRGGWMSWLLPSSSSSDNRHPPSDPLPLPQPHPVLRITSNQIPDLVSTPLKPTTITSTVTPQSISEEPTTTTVGPISRHPPPSMDLEGQADTTTTAAKTALKTTKMRLKTAKTPIISSDSPE